MSQMPDPPPNAGGGDTGVDRQTGTVKSRAMEAWTLRDRVQYWLRRAYLAVRGWVA